MPVLLNTRHELFAQGILTGLNPTDAYVLAGYTDEPAAAQSGGSRLLSDAMVSARINELLTMREQAVLGAAATATKISLEGHLAELERIKQLAEGWGDKGLSTLARCEELRGRSSGLYADKKVETIGPLDHLTAEEAQQVADICKGILAQRKAGDPLQ